MMSGIKGKDTKPEIAIRKRLFAAGYRYRLHDKRLPGKPDLVLPKYNAVIFINGCFWHKHDCHLFKWPVTRKTFWKKKLTRNHEKDRETLFELNRIGWRVATIWECSFRGPGINKQKEIAKICKKVVKWLESKKVLLEIKV